MNGKNDKKKAPSVRKFKKATRKFMKKYPTVEQRKSKLKGALTLDRAIEQRMKPSLPSKMKRR